MDTTTEPTTPANHDSHEIFRSGRLTTVVLWVGIAAFLLGLLLLLGQDDRFGTALFLGGSILTGSATIALSVSSLVSASTRCQAGEDES